MELSKKFGKFTADLSSFDDCGSTTVCCDIHVGNYYQASLQCADDTGKLEDMDSGLAVKIDQKTIDSIRAWAEANGY